MNHTQIGIVLRRYIPHKQKVSLFDRSMGRIEVIRSEKISLERFYAGSIIQYRSVEVHSHWYALDMVDMLHVPLGAAREDIFFLHHLLELAYYFLPPHQQMQEVFDLLLFFSKAYSTIRTSLQKKIFLLRFFAYLGMYPEEDLIAGEVMHAIMYQPIDELLSKPVVLSERILDQWLVTCIDGHPQKGLFKTHAIGIADVR